MRRADRLILVIHYLRGRRAVPIEGETGVGYTLRKGSDIPPLVSMDLLDEVCAMEPAQGRRAYLDAMGAGPDLEV